MFMISTQQQKNLIIFTQNSLEKYSEKNIFLFVVLIRNTIRRIEILLQKCSSYLFQPNHHIKNSLIIILFLKVLFFLFIDC